MSTDAVPVVHVVTDDDILARQSFVVTAGAIAEALGRAGALHIRTRRMLPAQVITLIDRLRERGQRRTPRIVVNDRVDVALTTDAYGVQLGAESMGVSDVRRIEGEVKLREHGSGTARRFSRQPLRIGVSVHLADDHRTAGADWIIAGHVFSTPSHSDKDPRGLEFIAQVARQVRAPVIAIGGIRPEHVDDLVEAGAAGVAVIRGIWDAPDPADAAQRYLDALRRHSSPDSVT